MITERQYTPSKAAAQWTDETILAANSKRGAPEVKLRRINARYLADIAHTLPAVERQRAVRTIANLEG